jgi:hypothetical protein
MEFADRGHSLTIDSGWREVAEACLAWLGRQAGKHARAEQWERIAQMTTDPGLTARASRLPPKEDRAG